MLHLELYNARTEAAKHRAHSEIHNGSPAYGILICSYPFINDKDHPGSFSSDFVLPSNSNSIPNLNRKRNEELHQQLAFTTSSNKKRKLALQSAQSVDGQIDRQRSLSEPRDVNPTSPIDLSAATNPQESLAEATTTLRSHLHESLTSNEETSSAASSPSATYSSLTLESESRSFEHLKSRSRLSSPQAESASLRQTASHRSIMGGAADLPRRSSSPLKRTAESMESDDPPPNATQDVSMRNSAEDSSLEQSSRHARAVSVDMLAESTPSVEIPSIDEQIETIVRLVTEEAHKNYEEGDKVYLISLQWLNRVQARGSKAKPSADIATEGEIGPIDNSNITREVLKDVDGNEFVRLNEGTGEESFAVFPEDAWMLVYSWYGLPQDTPPITRTAHNTNSSQNGLPNVQIEFHPLVLKLHRLWSRVCPIPLPAELKANDPPAPIMVVPKSANYREVLKKIKNVLAIEMENKVRLWRIDTSQKLDDEDAPPTPVSQEETQSEPLADAFHKLLVEVPKFLALEDGTQREKMPVEARDTTIDPQATSKQTVGVAFSGADTIAMLDEEVSGTSDFVSTYTTITANKVPIITLKLKSTESKQPNDEGGRSSPAQSGPVTRGRSRKTGKTLGCVGLTNLGNTCYMNSALQCVRSVEELTKFFLTGEWSNELNVDNPLGNNGEVASSYARLLDEFYRDGTSVVRPSQFKSTIGRYAPSFSGYGQQDSQEFLGFLLDGLQEDLSRIKKKPYIEKPDSTDEMVNNPEAIREMAAKVWDITKKRDDSVIADLFTGMYKSTLVCPVCAKVSITFDPFNNLTLQLPIENTWNHTVRFFPLNDYPVQIDVDMDKNGTIKALKTFVSKRINVPAERLMVVEEWKQKLYKVFDDFMVVSEENIQKSDIINVYELEDIPTNYPPTKKPKRQQRSMLNVSDDDDEIPAWDSPEANMMLVPVHHRQGSAQYKQQWKTTLIPHLILLTPEEAKSEDAIKRKILEKVATLTTHAEFHESEDSDGTVDHDGVIMSGSDSSEGKVVAKSIDGEDDVVDVTMNDPNDVRESTEKPDGSEIFIPQNNSTSQSRRPKFVDSREYLQPIMQNLFTISYHASTKKALPVGYDTVKDDYVYPLILTRAPHTVAEDGAESQEEFSGSEAHIPNADGEEDGSTEIVPTRMVEESDSEDELAKADVPVRRRHFAGKGRRLGNKTYSLKNRKAARAARSSDTISESEINGCDGGPLVRPGEGLIVDWSHDAFSTLFDGTAGDSMRGQCTLNNPPVLPDPELTAKRDKRSLKRKQGITLDDCLDEFGKEEILSEMDTWYCPRCKEHRRASKKFELWKTPDILVMHLKRFSSSTTRRDKLDVLVDFPIEGLDLSSRVIENQEGKKEIYDLFAVDDHWGGLGGGHYTAHAKSFFDGQWYEYNDSSVSKKTNVARIVTPGAYLLFYRRRSDKPLGGQRLQEIVERYDNPDAENSDSGEAQRLDADSSLRGSSSALQRETGVEAPHPHPHPLVGLGGQLTKTNTYHSIISEDEVMDDIVDHPAEILGPLKPFSLIDQQQWSFNNITSQDIGDGRIPRSEASSFDASARGSLDDRSDIVDDNSSIGSEERMQRIQDFNDAVPDDFEEQSIVPDLTEEQQYAAIGLEDIQHLAPRASGEDEEVKEIHVEEGEGVTEK